MSKSSKIETWQEREQYTTDDGIIMNSMQEEINELRAALRTYEDVMFELSVRLHEKFEELFSEYDMESSSFATDARHILKGVYDE